MCRFFAALTIHPSPVSPWLTQAHHSLLTQSRIDPRRRQRDGWGVAAVNGQIDVKKSAAPIYSEMTRAKKWEESTKGYATLGHIRQASNPAGLPLKALIGPPHTQPFAHDGWIFVHNGTLNIPEEVKAELGDWRRFVRGRNDSEVLFYWLLKTVVHASRGSYVTRVRRSLRSLNTIWQRVKSQHPDKPYAFRGLNWVLTNGHDLVALCLGEPSGWGSERAFYSKKTPWYQLHAMQRDTQLVIASEPETDEEGWRPFQNGELLIARRGVRSLSVRRENILSAAL